MADESKRKLKDVPPKPTSDKLPRPTVLWTGSSEREATRWAPSDARLVLKYEWVLPGGADDWEITPKVVYEVISGVDSLDTPIWGPLGLEQLPVAFFLQLAEQKAGA